MLGCSAAGLAGLCAHREASSANETKPHVRTITRGPKHHWFGYYDKFQFDPTDRYVLGMEVGFEHRSPQPEDEIRVGMVDIQEGDRWIDLGGTKAWCWQQGCMLQWVPGRNSEVIWNDRDANGFVSHILDVATNKQRTIPHPIYTLSPNGTTALAPDFSRLHDLRPGYGYAGRPDPHADELAPKNTGLYLIDLESGDQTMLFSFAEIAEFGTPKHSMQDAKHSFNHLLFNPDGSRFVFLHRWRYPNGVRLSRMITAKPDGSDRRILDDNGLTSHFLWRDNAHILAWSNQPSHGAALYLFQDGANHVEVVGHNKIKTDGHVNFLPGGNWVVDDTYPDADRNQEVFLYHMPTDRRISLGKFTSPPSYTGEWRCDTHPRVSRNGRMLVIDSPHTGAGRQMHMIDLADVVD